MTEDMLWEQEKVLARLGTTEEAAQVRAKMQSSSLISDMQAFKVPSSSPTFNSLTSPLFSLCSIDLPPLQQAKSGWLQLLVLVPLFLPPLLSLSPPSLPPSLHPSLPPSPPHFLRPRLLTLAVYWKTLSGGILQEIGSKTLEKKPTCWKQERQLLTLV